jgi:hypothetical protein
VRLTFTLFFAEMSVARPQVNSHTRVNKIAFFILVGFIWLE